MCPPPKEATEAPGPITPQKAAKEALAYLREGADPDRAASFQRYFKEPIAAYGLPNAPLKEWRLAFFARVTPHWTLPDAIAFCDLMVEDPHLEARAVGFRMVADFVDDAGPELLDEAHRWLEEACGNWGLVDNLAPSMVSPLVRKYPKLVKDVKRWTASENQWVRRGAPVAFVSLVDDPKLRRHAYDIATKLLDDDEDLIHKAVGWMLREAGKVDRDELEAYLLEKGPRVPRTALRYAIEKFPKEDRKRIMEATR